MPPVSTHLCIALLVAGTACAATPSPDHAVASSHATDLAPSGAAASDGRVPCDQELALECSDGVDGCLDQRTTVHACVDELAEAGPPCAQELALACPAGQADGCLASPPITRDHLCVAW